MENEILLICELSLKCIIGILGSPSLPRSPNLYSILACLVLCTCRVSVTSGVLFSSACVAEVVSDLKPGGP